MIWSSLREKTRKIVLVSVIVASCVMANLAAISFDEKLYVKIRKKSQTKKISSGTVVNEVIFIRDSNSRFRLLKYQYSPTDKSTWDRALRVFIEVGGIGVVGEISHRAIRNTIRDGDKDVVKIELLRATPSDTRHKTGEDVLTFKRVYSKDADLDYSIVEYLNDTGRQVKERRYTSKGSLSFYLIREYVSADDISDDAKEPIAVHLKRKELDKFAVYLRYFKLTSEDAEGILAQVMPDNKR